MLFDILTEQTQMSAKPVTLIELNESVIEILELNEEINTTEVRNYFLSESAILQEGVLDSIKAFFQKIMDFAKRVGTYISEKFEELKFRIQHALASNEKKEVECVDPNLANQLLMSAVHLEMQINSLDLEDTRAVVNVVKLAKELQAQHDALNKSKKKRLMSGKDLVKLNAIVGSLGKYAAKINELLKKYENIAVEEVKHEAQTIEEASEQGVKKPSKVGMVARKVASICFKILRVFMVVASMTFYMFVSYKAGEQAGKKAGYSEGTKEGFTRGVKIGRSSKSRK